jgi:hypothetical protein
VHVVAFHFSLYVPAGHNTPVVLVEPTGHADPGGDAHELEHAVVASTAPATVPEVPSGHAVHVRLPPPPYRPAGHGTPEGLVDPRGQ